MHVTVPADRLPCDVAAVIPVPKDRRSIFVVPWPGMDLVYLGTTDSAYSGSLDDPACTPEDVDYLLEAANNVTTSRLTRSDVTGISGGTSPVAGASGQGRPRVGADGGPVAPAHGVHVAARAGHRHRRQADHVPQDGTGHRRRGRAGPRRVPATASVRHEVAGPPRVDDEGRGTRSRWRNAPAASCTRYGTEQAAVLAVADGRPDLLEPAVPGLPYTGAELVYAAREEMALTLDDVLARRTRAGIQRAHATMAAAPALARLLAPEMGWDEREAAGQAARFVASCQKELLTAGLDSRDGTHAGHAHRCRARRGARPARGARRRGARCRAGADRSERRCRVDGRGVPGRGRT